MKAKPARERKGEKPQPVCEGVSPLDEPCNLPATVQCERCERWFCAGHAEDDEWHPCVLAEGEEGGEG